MKILELKKLIKNWKIRTTKLITGTKSEFNMYRNFISLNSQWDFLPNEETDVAGNEIIELVNSYRREKS